MAFAVVALVLSLISIVLSFFVSAPLFEMRKSSVLITGAGGEIGTASFIGWRTTGRVHRHRRSRAAGPGSCQKGTVR